MRYLNEAIADLGKNKANFAMARRMFLRRMEKDLILAVVEGLEADALDDIAKRLEAERGLAVGDVSTNIAQDLSLSEKQLEPIENLIAARNALIKGGEHSDIANAFEMPISIIKNEAEQLSETLDDIWPSLEGTAPLDDAAQLLIVSVSALDYMRHELKAKMRLDAGEAADQIAAAAGVSLETVKGWASSLAAAKIDADAMSEEEKAGNIMTIAAVYRLPSALITAVT